jgi:hypothetical protein
MWKDAYAKILEEAGVSELALLLVIGLLITGIVTIWRAWRKDLAWHRDLVEQFSDALNQMREILIVIKERLRKP